MDEGMHFPCRLPNRAAEFHDIRRIIALAGIESAEDHAGEEGNASEALAEGVVENLGKAVTLIVRRLDDRAIELLAGRRFGFESRILSYWLDPKTLFFANSAGQRGAVGRHVFFGNGYRVRESTL
jgi:hypothetical protein